MGDILLLSLTAAVNPTLLAAVTIMLLLPHPKRLMLGYLLGGLMVSIALGLVIVFTLSDSSAVSSTRNTISPIADLVLGAIALLVAFVLHTGRHERLAARRRERKEAKQKGEPWTQRVLGRGSARVTFAVGAVLSFPGVSYLAALRDLGAENASTAETVLVVVAFNLVMFILLELPLLGYALAPDWTPDAVARFRAWLGRSGGRIATIGTAVIGMAFVVRGVIGLLT